jgi:hypothetical protein
MRTPDLRMTAAPGRQTAGKPTIIIIIFTSTARARHVRPMACRLSRSSRTLPSRTRMSARLGRAKARRPSSLESRLLQSFIYSGLVCISVPICP